MKKYLIISILLGPASISFAGRSDTIRVYFDLAVPTLNTSAMQQLDSLAYYEVLVPNKNYGIIGYADYLGSEESNVTLSQNRADAVQQYLQGLGIKPQNIETVTGKGEVNRDMAGDEGYPEDRRVDIVIGGLKKTVKPRSEPKPPVKIPPTEKPAPKIDISALEKDEVIRLENIFFLPGSHKIREESTETLFNLYIVMKDHPTLKISIEGHICCLVNTTHDGYDYDAQEYRLSENRARAVYEYLAEKGIDKNRMAYKGFGISKPLKWPERSQLDENTNRRVEIRIVDK